MNAVYQICTPTVKSHGPDKGTTLVAAVPGSAHGYPGLSDRYPDLPRVSLFQMTDLQGGVCSDSHDWTA